MEGRKRQRWIDLARVPDLKDLDDLLATIRKVYRALLPVVPTLLIAMPRHPLVRTDKVDLRSIKLWVSGAVAAR